ncbi:MAG: DNA alkylation repair protein [Chthonomonas sp.]|nr:DNA alkylation repair protein [Chthonomonas sp.]
MTCQEVLDRMEATGTERMRQFNVKNGYQGAQFGLKMGDLRVVAKEVKTDHALAKELWASGNLDARLLATLVCKPKQFTMDELRAMVTEATLPQLADWLNSYVIKQHADKETMRLEWETESDPMLQRTSWSLTTERINKAAEGLDLDAILATLAEKMPSAPEAARWLMNFALIAVGTQSAEHREAAIALGDRLGFYRDYPTSPGCTSPFAPIAIRELARRAG